MGLLIFYFLSTLLISFTCSLMESVLLSTSPIFVKINENSPKKGVRKLCKCKNNIDKSLSAILSLNTIANTAGASMVGAQATSVLGSEALGIISALLTVLIFRDFAEDIGYKLLGASRRNSRSSYYNSCYHYISACDYGTATYATS